MGGDERQASAGAFDEAIQRAREVAGDKAVAIGGGADVIRQGVAAGVIDELAIIVAPVILGGGKALLDGFAKSLELKHISVRQLEWATLIEYRVKSSGDTGRARQPPQADVGVCLPK
jgi:dihydrofolate reductase